MQQNTPEKYNKRVKNKNLLLVSLLVYLQVSLSIILIVLLYTYKNRFFDIPYTQCTFDTKKELEGFSGDIEVEISLDSRYKLTQARKMIEDSGMKVVNVKYASYDNKNIFTAVLSTDNKPELGLCKLKDLPATQNVKILANKQP